MRVRATVVQEADLVRQVQRGAYLAQCSSERHVERESSHLPIAFATPFMLDIGRY